MTKIIKLSFTGIVLLLGVVFIHKLAGNMTACPTGQIAIENGQCRGTGLTQPGPTADPAADTSEKAGSVGKYASCTVYSRRNINTYESNTRTLTDSSEIRCTIDNSEKTLVSVKNKKGFTDAANSIYKFWHDTDGYKILIVDQNGAGSGEGYGKILLLRNASYALDACFNFIPEDFITINVPIKFLSSLSRAEQEAVKINTVNALDEHCTNFTLTSTIE